MPGGFAPVGYPVGGGSSATPSLVFRPGGVAAPGVYVDEPSLVAASLLLNGAAYTILFDLSLVAGVYTFATVGLLGLAPNATWTSNGLPATIVFAHGTTLSDVPELVGVDGTQSGEPPSFQISITQAAPVITLALTSSIYRAIDGASFAQSGAGGSWIRNTGTSAVRLNVTNGANLGNGTTVGAEPLLVGVHLDIYAGVQIWPNAISLLGDSTILVYGVGSATDPSFYPVTVVQGVLTDYAGTGATLVDPVASDGGVIVNTVTGTIYVSDGISWVAAGGGGTQPASLVFRPGGVAAPGVFVDEPSLAAATNALNGAAYTILFDLSLSTTPSPGAYTFATVGLLNLAPNGTWTSNGIPAVLAFSVGTTLADVPNLVGNGQTPDTIGNASLEIVIFQAATVNTSALTAPQFRTIIGASVYQSATGGAWIDNTGGTSPYTVIATGASNLGDGTPAATPLLVGVELLAFAGVLVNTAAISTAGDSSVIVYGTGSTIDPALYPFTIVKGTINDASGTAAAAIPAAGSQGGVIVDSTSALLYISDGASWSLSTPWVLSGDILSPRLAASSILGGSAASAAGLESFAWGFGATALHSYDVAFAGSLADSTLSGGDHAFAAAGGSCYGSASVAICGGIVQSNAGNAFACGADAEASGTYDVAFGLNANANSQASGGNSATAFADGTASGDHSFAGPFSTAAGNSSASFAQGTANGQGDFAVGFGSVATSPALPANTGSCFAAAGGNASGIAAVAIGGVTVTEDYSFAVGTDGGARLGLNRDGAGTLELDCGANQSLVVGNIAQQTTVGPAGAASPLPALPSTYVLITLGATEYAIPCYLPA